MIATLFLIFIGLLIVSVPIGGAQGIASVVLILTEEPISIETFAKAMISGFNSFPLIAIPLFTFAGDIMGKGGISKRLINVAKLGLGNMTGGLGIVSIVTCMFFAAISGTGGAAVAGVGLIMIPEMAKAGYNKTYATSMVATAGTIGVIIPPSICMVVYAVAAGTSVTAMFTAGFPVGILVGLFLCGYCYFSCKKAGYKPVKVKYTGKEIGKVLLEALPSFIIPIIVLGGIYGGVYTPTEAAGIACVLGIIISVFVYKEVKIKEIPYIAYRSAIVTAPSMLIIGISTGFGRILTLTQIPIIIAEAILSITDNAVILLILINILLLIVGTFMETNAAIMILTPILLPIATSVGVNPVHFGMIMVLNLAIGFVTPPLGVNLFVASEIGKERFDDLAKRIWPWVATMVAALLIVTYVPDLSLFLPRLLDIPV